MKEQVLNVLKMLGFQVEEIDDFGYGFLYEGINFLYMPNDEDEEFLSISIPAVLEVNEENKEAVYLLMDKINLTRKYVKANMLADSMWLFYERELIGGEDMEKLVSRMIFHLETAIQFFYKQMAMAGEEFVSDDDDDDEEDTEDVA